MSTKLPRIAIRQLGRIGDRAIAEQHAVPISLVTAERERRGIAPAPSGPRPKGDAARSERIQVLVLPAVAARIDQARGRLSRSSWAADVLERALGGSR